MPTMLSHKNDMDLQVIPSFTAIIQARLESSRLPHKALLDLAGRPILAHIIERTKKIKNITKIVLATGRSPENKKLLDLAYSLGIESYVGSDDNVLERFYETMEEFGGDYIVRITGDNPFMDPDYASLAVDLAMTKNPDLCSIVNLPLGIAVEIIKREALVTAFRESTKPYHFEHVTPYIKENESRFYIEWARVIYDNPFPSLRLTVDEEDDYNIAKTIYGALYQGELFTLQQVIDFLRLNPSLVTVNKHVRQRSMTESANK